MSISTPTLKRHNHRVHPCKIEKKDELLDLLLTKNSDKKIFVITSDKSSLSSNQDNVTFVCDKELDENSELRCDLLISYDLPQDATTYMARTTRTNSHAIILLDSTQEKLLHPIEILNGRTIMQEPIDGFSEEIVQKQSQPKKKEPQARVEKREFKPRDDKKEFRPKKKFDDSKGEKKPWDKKDKKENKYLGKDENGKAIFSGKSGDRNHRYDGTPKSKPPKLTGKKINIKSLKKSDKSE